jgi:carbon storage regulator CsrA
MLVLSRKVGQRIVIAENIDIAVLEIHGNTVRLGLTAPRDLSVHRLNARDKRAPCAPKRHTGDGLTVEHR